MRQKQMIVTWRTIRHTRSAEFLKFRGYSQVSHTECSKVRSYQSRCALHRRAASADARQPVSDQDRTAAVAASRLNASRAIADEREGTLRYATTSSHSWQRTSSRALCSILGSSTSGTITTFDPSHDEHAISTSVEKTPPTGWGTRVFRKILLFAILSTYRTEPGRQISRPNIRISNNRAPIAISLYLRSESVIANGMALLEKIVIL